MSTIERYDWPGKIRELQNVIERRLDPLPRRKTQEAQDLGVADQGAGNPPELIRP